MAYSAKVGNFNLDHTVTAGNDQSVSGVGFQPKIVLFWWSGSTATGDSVAGGTIRPGFGAAVSSSSRFSVYGYSVDAGATADANSGQDDDNCIKAIASGTSIEGEADFKSMDADGFTLTIDDQFANDYRISYLALGGDDLSNVYISNFRTPTSTGNHSVTGVGFRPDALIFAGVALDTADSTGQYLDLTLGWATGSSNQGVVYISAYDEVSVSNTWSYNYNAECIATLEDGGSMKVREALVSLDADGFTLNLIERSNQKYFHYVALKGGQYLVGDLTTRTDSNDIAETVGFQPVAVMFASANKALSTQDTPTAHARLSIGAATGASARTVQAISDEDNLSDTETAHTVQDDAVYAHIIDDAIEALMDLKSIDADGFTCVMDDTEGTARWVTYLAIGAVASTGLSVATADALTLGESVGRSLGDLISSVADSVTLGDAAAAYMGIGLTVADSATLGESIGRGLGDLLAGVADNLTVGDVITAALAEALGLSVADALTLGESVSAALGATGEHTLSVGEAISLGETVAAIIGALHASSSETLTIGETVAVILGALTASASDAITLGETATAVLSALALDASDSLTLGEAVGVAVLAAGISALSVADALTIGDAVAVVIAGALTSSVADALTLGDALSVILDLAPVNITVADTLSVGEAVTIGALTLAAILSDRLTVGDSVTVSGVAVPLLDVALSEAAVTYVLLSAAAVTSVALTAAISGRVTISDKSRG